MNDLKSGRSSLLRITNGLQSLGLLNGDAAKYLNTTVYAMQLGIAAKGIWSTINGLLEIRHQRETAKAAALTAANAITPAGWAKIAIAAAVAGVATAGITAAVNRVNVGSFDLSTTIGRDAAAKAVQAVV